MKNKIIKYFFIVFLLSSAINCFSQSEDTTPKPYEEQEFEQWQIDLRRFEIITFGSLPFITLDTILIYTGYNWASGGFASTFPNPFAAMSTFSQNEIIGILVVSFTISLCIAITDYFIHKAKREAIQQKKPEDIYVLPEELNPTSQEIKLPDK